MSHAVTSSRSFENIITSFFYRLWTRNSIQDQVAFYLLLDNFLVRSLEKTQWICKYSLGKLQLGTEHLRGFQETS